MAQSLSPEDIVKAEFDPPTHGRGYDELAVDDFLDRVVHQMRAGTFDPVEIARVQLPMARGFGRRGYDTGQVDDLLARLSGAEPSATPPAGDGTASWGSDESRLPAPTEVTRSSIEQPFVERKSLLSRIFGRG